MADRIRLVNLQWPLIPAVLVDFSPAGNAGLLRDSFKITLPDPIVSLAAASNRWGGERTAVERRSNATVSFTVMAIGATGPAAVRLVQNIFNAALDSNMPNLAIEWRPDGATYSEFWELRGAPKIGLDYSWVKMASANYVPVELAFPTAPSATGYPMDIEDSFSIDTIASGDWVKDAGTNSLTVTGGFLQPTATGGAVKWRYRNPRYAYQDVETAITIVPGGSSAIFRLCLAMDTAGADTYLALECDSTGSRVIKVVAGTPTTLSSAGTTAFTANAPLYLLFRKAGNVLYWRVATSVGWTEWTTEPNTYTLTGADLRFAGPGHVGIVGVAGTAGIGSAEAYGPYTAKPYVYRGIQSPEEVQLVGQIPGDVQARADVEVTPVVGASTSPALFGLIAIGERPQPPNLVTQGNFSTIRSNASATYGWQVAAVTGVQAAAGTSFVRQAAPTAQKYSSFNLHATLPATIGAGVNLPITRRFKRGKHYLAWLWGGNVTGTSPQPQVKFGVNGDLATGTTSLASSPPWTGAGVVWQPTADYDVAYLSVQNGTAVACQFDVDGVNVVEIPTCTLAASLASGAAATTFSPWFTPTDLPDLNPDGSVSKPFLVAIDSELMRVRAISTAGVWTVDRGAEGTIANAHNADALIAVLPPLRPQFEGKGALPVFGIHEAEYYAFDRIAPTAGASTDYRAGGYIGYTGSGNYIFYVDPSLSLPDDWTQGELLVELWGRFAFDPAMTGGIVTTSATPSEQYDPTAAISTGAGPTRYTLEYGSSGQALVSPTGSSGQQIPQFLKLGVIPMYVDKARPQRWRVIVAITGTALAHRMDYLLTVPLRMRVATPTGKASADTTYPSFMPNAVAANAVTRVLRADGSGAIKVPRLSASRAPDPYPDAGLGPPIDIPNGDVNLIAKLSNLVPNDPGSEPAEMFTAQPYWQTMLHVAVTPRYSGMRGA